MRRPWALPLQPLYGAVVAGKAALFERGLLRAEALARPVVSIGSLSAGGAGKTPFVIALSRLLAANGIRADVLTRGYGRSARTVEQVTGAGDSRRFGDEPTEMRQAGLEVYVGASRLAAGRLSERSHAAELHLLDDGLQHRQLARALDVVLLTREDVRDTLLPAGNLREGLRALRRADAVVLREEEADKLRAEVARHTPAEVWTLRRSLAAPGPDAPRRPFAFCALARPDGFAGLLRQSRVELAGFQAFADHHVYTPADLQRLVASARACAADGFCVTAKDATKLPAESLAILQGVGPVWVARLEVALLDEAAILARSRRVLIEHRTS